MGKTRTIALVIVLAVLALSLPAIANSQHDLYLPQVAAQVSLLDLPLLNPGFESSFREVDSVPELKVGEHWYPWWDEAAARPEYKRADPAIDASRVRSGNSAQQWFNTYNKHTAGIYQTVLNVPFGKTVVFEAWVQAFSSNQDDFSQSNGKYRMRIGIDPYGGTDPESADVVWSNNGNAIEPYDAFYFLQVQATASSDRVTVFVWGQAEWALKHNDAYVDDTRLYVLDGSVPPTGTPSPGGLTEAQVRQIVREELATAVQAWANSLSQQ